MNQLQTMHGWCPGGRRVTRHMTGYAPVPPPQKKSVERVCLFQTFTSSTFFFFHRTLGVPVSYPTPGCSVKLVGYRMTEERGGGGGGIGYSRIMHVIVHTRICHANGLPFQQQKL